ncbi:hypothetical protein PGTUg99_032564 [Puccinia graminis f. sp. tritici]|uniref:Uncharacterized protein n=1 Tax=Puccinia graminis f. sp. tritici TaxID=56615 RepID=A0A5B0NI01_PUCGR|nr:hypothetical protein PGTUg99_032564 [Puccinia graminis f. sp. tritici]
MHSGRLQEFHDWSDRPVRQVLGPASPSSCMYSEMAVPGLSFGLACPSRLSRSLIAQTSKSSCRTAIL